MERFFDADGDDGRRMMCTTAAVQVNLDLGTGGEAARRWRLAHVVGPTLAAAFANSPVAVGRETGWRSTRLATWWAIDATRTSPVGGDSPAEAWADYALSARVMLVRRDDGRFVPQTGSLRLIDWIRQGHELGHPTEDDVDYHLTTLFPPVRPRGWLEIRVIDALPDPWWRVAAAITTALVDHEEAAATAAEAAVGAAGLWREAARDGLEHPALADAAQRCFVAALTALPDLDVDADTQTACAAFLDRYTARRRCPADDVLDAWRAGTPRSPSAGLLSSTTSRR
jgi:glutamate--cysteine ligase